MVKNRRALILAGAGVALVAVVWALSGPDQPPAAAAARPGAAAPRSGPREGELPRVGLERVRQAVVRPEVGRRDIFDFGVDPREEEARLEAERQEQMEAPPPMEPTPTPVPTPTPLPPLTVKYIGSLESKPGLKVAFFVTEKKEVVSGQVGETVMNRFRVVRIGFESVDVQQVGADQVQRLPLKGN